MISLTDAVGLDVPTAKRTLLDAGRWLLAGALAELTVARAELLSYAPEATLRKPAGKRSPAAGSDGSGREGAKFKPSDSHTDERSEPRSCRPRGNARLRHGTGAR